MASKPKQFYFKLHDRTTQGNLFSKILQKECKRWKENEDKDVDKDVNVCDSLCDTRTSSATFHTPEVTKQSWKLKCPGDKKRAKENDMCTHTYTHTKTLPNHMGRIVKFILLLYDVLFYSATITGWMLLVSSGMEDSLD